MLPSVILALTGLVGPTLAITGSIVAERLHFPYMASVGIASEHICGGILVNASIVLTSAACASVITPGSANVEIGVNNIRFPEADTERMFISLIIVHEDYDSRSGENDLALLWLEDASKFTPAKLAASPPKVGDEVTLAGWGANREGGQLRDKLSLTTNPIISRSDCKTALPDEEIPATVLCDMTPGGGRGACEGDAGGPVVGKDGAVVGVISRFLDDQSCGTVPDVVVDLTQYKTWIAKNSQPAALAGADAKKDL